MAKPNLPADRFRSATDFPKTVNHLDRPELDALYLEMRDCLIFTNRSRAQLIRRNQEHKDKTGLLKEDVTRLQGMIQQLSREKQQTVQQNLEIIQALEAEMASMVSHLDELSGAFDTIADIETAEQAQRTFFTMPARLFRFMRAVKAIVLWWRSDRSESLPPLTPNPHPSLPPTAGVDEDEDRRERPQMYTDPASINRSLLDR